MFVYTVLSPLIGWMGDRYSRRKLLAFGVGLWSVATVGTTFSQNFAQMCLWRALLGVGEASYGIVAPTLLADFFPPKHRGGRSAASTWPCRWEGPSDTSSARRSAARPGAGDWRWA